MDDFGDRSFPGGWFYLLCGETGYLEKCNQGECFCQNGFTGEGYRLYQ